ncbi:hypothetical protein ZIOFF_033243 [Zingiber officinale]|uniref:Phytocyanin domain-containing protein n=1 Tax=Zingiber officinale TaxID=94328 RepID=A0A8J5L706_ZINOF|nr:hypothetical protein ZIOFF_033243 [Zingiber officinale]
MAIAALPSVWVLIVASLLLRSTVSAIKFRVGGEKGWTEPNGDAAENYNHWASHNRFRVGDSLYFKYENDSLLEVTKEDYKKCYTANPLRKFASGITTVALDRSGLFFFISGHQHHHRFPSPPSIGWQPPYPSSLPSAKPSSSPPSLTDYRLSSNFHTRTEAHHHKKALDAKLSLDIPSPSHQPTISLLLISPLWVRKGEAISLSHHPSSHAILTSGHFSSGYKRRNQNSIFSTVNPLWIRRG